MILNLIQKPNYVQDQVFHMPINNSMKSNMLTCIQVAHDYDSGLKSVILTEASSDFPRFTETYVETEMTASFQQKIVLKLPLDAV